MKKIFANDLYFFIELFLAGICIKLLLVAFLNYTDPHTKAVDDFSDIVSTTYVTQ